MSRSVIGALRDMVPIRPLTRNEALSIAERQALTFHKIVGSIEPPFPERLIAELPRLHIEHVSPWPVSGATHWVNGRWVVVLNGSEANVRQRFSLAHELKHILDHRFINVIYDGIPLKERHHFIEQVCDYFAGALLVPRPWLKRAWTNGTQSLPELAHRFNVSQAAMNTRLHQTGIAPPTPRCTRPPKHWALEAIKKAGTDALYHRAAPMALTP